MLNHPFNVLRHHQRDRAPKDPVTIGMAIATAAGVAGSATATFLITTAVHLAISAVVGFAISALTPKPKTLTGTQTNIKDAAAAGEIVYGSVRKGGVITFAETNGGDNSNLHMVIVLAAHEVDSIGNIYLDDEVVTLDADGWVTGPAKWLDPGGSGTEPQIRIRKFTGASTQPAFQQLVDETSVDTNFRGRGIAYLYVQLFWDSEVFLNGIPLVTAIVNGKKVYDPRTGLTTYSNNAALCIRDYLTDKMVGVGADASEIDDTAFSTAAGDCGDDINLAVSGTQKRYTLNGIVSTADSPRNNLDKMLTACAGSLFWGQGKFKLKVGKWRAPVKTLTLDDVKSEITINTKTTIRDNFNVIKGTFLSAKDDFVVSDYPELRSSAFITEDGGLDNVLDLELPFTTNEATAQRIAKLVLFRSREQIVFTADFGLDAFDLEVGDNVNLSIARYGWEPKVFEVLDWALKINPESGSVVQLTLKETSAASFDWNAEEATIINNNSGLPNPFSGTAVSNIVAAEQGYVTPEGNYSSGVEVTWTAATSKFVRGYLVEWTASGGTKWSSMTTMTNSILIETMRPNVQYVIRVRSLTSFGGRGQPSQINVTLGKDNTAPAVISNTGWTATGETNQITLNWVNPTADDFRYVEIWENTVNNSATATMIGRSFNGYFRRTVTPGQTRYYWLKSVDATKNASAFSAVRSATAEGINLETGQGFVVLHQKIVHLRPHPANPYDIPGGWKLTNPTKTVRTSLGSFIVRRKVGGRTKFTIGVSIGGAPNTPGSGVQDATCTIILQKKGTDGVWRAVQSVNVECGPLGRSTPRFFRFIDNDVSGFATAGITGTAYRIVAGKYNGQTLRNAHPVLRNLTVDVLHFKSYQS